MIIAKIMQSSFSLFFHTLNHSFSDLNSIERKGDVAWGLSVDYILHVNTEVENPMKHLFKVLFSISYLFSSFRAIEQPDQML